MFEQEEKGPVVGAKAGLSLRERHLFGLHAVAGKPVDHSSREDSTGGPGFPVEPECQTQMHRPTELLLGCLLNKPVFNLGRTEKF